MKTIPYFIIAILLFVIWSNSCNSETKKEIQYVTVKSTSGKETFEKPKQVIVTDQNKNSVIPKKDKDNNQFLKKDNEFLQKEIDKLLKYNDSLLNALVLLDDKELKEAYSNAIAINYFERKIDNDTVKIDVYGLTRGTIETMQIDWETKERKQEVQKKELLFRALLGGEIGVNKELNQGTYKINLGLQNKKNDILRFSYQRIGSNEFGLIGLDKSIFSVNKKVKK